MRAMLAWILAFIALYSYKEGERAANEQWWSVAFKRAVAGSFGGLAGLSAPIKRKIHDVAAIKQADEYDLPFKTGREAAVFFFLMQ